MEPINPAKRLYKLLEEFRTWRGDHSKPAVQAWAEVLGIAEEDDATRHHRAAVAVADLHFQTRAVLEAVQQQKKLPERLYKDTFRTLGANLSVGNLFSQHGEAIKALKPEVMVSLGYLAEILPEEENEIPREALDFLSRELGEFELSVMQADLPDDLRRFLFSQLDAIRRALREYPVKGAEAFKRAWQISLWEWQDYATTIEANKRSPAVTGVRRLWGIVAAFSISAGAALSSGASAIENADKIFAKGPEVLRELQQRLPGVLAEIKALPAGLLSEPAESSEPHTDTRTAEDSEKEGAPEGAP